MNVTRFTNGFSEKIILQGKQAMLSLKMMCIWICRKVFFFFEILHNERGQEVYGNYLNGFSEKNSHLWQMGILGSKMVHHNSGSTPKIFFEILHNERG